MLHSIKYCFRLALEIDNLFVSDVTESSIDSYSVSILCIIQLNYYSLKIVLANMYETLIWLLPHVVKKKMVTKTKIFRYTFMQ